MYVTSRNFTFNKATKTFATDISDLGKGFEFEPVYKDAADLGFTMVSSKTGKQVDFVMTEVIGEAEGWKFLPTNESVRRVPQSAALRVVIYND